ncbi:MAG: 50S ribosomal protein L9 [Oscillospiraceae bacterium]|jgi:large subunit ribosomal protein L9|nr:50S ribosomal protein L9 [Oscillospiraceae bacterium]
MEIILMFDVEKLGKTGDILNVADGYFRNYLFPRKLAKRATPQVIKDVKNKIIASKRRYELEQQNAAEVVQKIDGHTVDISAKAGETGKLYGSITNMDIGKAIKEKFDIDIDKHKIYIENEIRHFGVYECQVKFFSDISAKIFVNVSENII